ncbi:C4-dicarboxylate ABC transporter [Helicobacter monodelphidis]|uniref:SLAC1 anion channel family protein n=1 Tax=Helicobacter sp. 15-1451 TaxID=2004995 RepID=UPI000DCF16DD|nr:SLAC1 anion channel family protein [Helicobacter sp. 15-1451]RAX57939.1 C4-dicarboxylate ABC transporter [Helicobacter sp. 15-1451]
MHKISNFPIMFFAVIMGFGGLAMALRTFNENFTDPGNMSFFILRTFVLGLFIFFFLLYLAKIFINFNAVKEEFNHPVKINFFATFSISLLILANLFMDTSTLYNILFYSGLFLQSFLSFYIISFWINNNLELKHSSPAWFIPVVGNLIVILAAKNVENWLWFYFCMGVFFWVILFAIIFYRILFHEQMPNKFMPTLFILLAPPAVAFLGYLKLTKSFDLPAIFLLNLALFFMILLIFLYKNFLKLNFFLSWWAFTFPMAAFSVACFRASDLTGDGSTFFLGFGVFSFILLIVLIVFVSFYTMKNVLKGQICIPEV